MKILFSPSKSQKNDIPVLSDKTPLLFPEQTNTLIQKILEFSPQEIQNTFKISLEKSILLLDTYATKKPRQTTAIEMFSGTSFQELSIGEYSHAQLDYMNNHVCIMSALYGFLEPTNAVRSYRLDMNNNILKNTEYKNLYNFWLPYVSDYFKNEDIIINLASAEYSKMLKGIDKSNIITMHFFVIKNAVEKTVSVFSKQQRGKMLDYMIKNKINNVDNMTLLRNYSSDGFVFNIEKSDKYNYYFIKNLD